MFLDKIASFWVMSTRLNNKMSVNDTIVSLLIDLESNSMYSREDWPESSIIIKDSSNGNNNAIFFKIKH
jgi:hypothetical protein